MLKGVEDRRREPCYLAVRLRAVNALDVKTMRAKVVFRVFLVFRPHNAAKSALPTDAKHRIKSDCEAEWKPDLVDALPTLAIKNGREISDKEPLKEFFRVEDAKLISKDGKEQDLWFPPASPDPDCSEHIAILTYQMEAEVTLDMNLKAFPFDSHDIAIKLFLPKKHKDWIYEFVCSDDMHIASERIHSKNVVRTGHGTLEVVPDAMKSLCEWENVNASTDTKAAKSDQTEATFTLKVRRLPQFWQDKVRRMCPPTHAIP